VCGKLPVFPGLCPPKSGPQIGDRRKAGFCALIRPAVSNAVTSEEFVEGFTPPDYLIDGFLQRQFIYALTGQTGSGKTAIALFIAYCVAKGRALGAREVQAGRVIVFAGENLMTCASGGSLWRSFSTLMLKRLTCTSSMAWSP
jgi:hypothetical protein